MRAASCITSGPSGATMSGKPNGLRLSKALAACDRTSAAPTSITAAMSLRFNISFPIQSPLAIASFAQLAKEAAHLLHEQLRLLEGCEMSALRHLAPMLDVGIGRLHPAPHRRHDLPWEDGDAR